ncbi:MAG: N-acetylmuramoyl-L-alanine amidase [Bacteroidaceae bacterium]|nr:N-acetylmuramoyl-L-alanine amidase [Bacteroidaceae bacterium]
MKSKLLIILMLFPLLLFAQGKRPLVWVIDAGHGGHDHGTKGKNITEKEINLKVSQEVVRLIRKHKPGIKVITTRKTDKFVSLAERCRIANNARADLFLSIHVNWARKKDLRGTETFYAANSRTKRRNPNASKSELLARLLQNNYAASGRPIYRGVRTNRMYVTANTNMPAALTEIAFISNSADAAYITTDKGMKETACMIFNALMEYYTTTQNKTHTKSLSTLRSSRDKKSGVKNSIRVSVNSGGSSPIVVEDEENDSKQAEVVEKKTEKAKSSETKSNAKQAQSKKQEAEKTAKAEAKPVAKASAKQKNAKEAQPVFSIQLFSCSAEMKQTDKRLKGVSPVTFTKEGKMFKCLYGGTTDYQKIKNQLKTIRKKFPDAFIVAYLGEKSITTAEALKIINEKK